MIRDELLAQLAMLPADADIVVDIGETEENILAVSGVSYGTERNAITLKPYHADLRDSIRARQSIAGPNSTDRVEPGSGAAVPYQLFVHVDEVGETTTPKQSETCKPSTDLVG